MNTKLSTMRDSMHCTIHALFVLTLVLSAFVSTSPAQEAVRQRRASSSLTSEDLLDRRAAYTPTADTALPSRSSLNTSVSTFYRDPSGAFSLNLPNANWRINAKSQFKGKLYDRRVFSKLDEDGFASATASVYVFQNATSLSVSEAVRLDAQARRSLAETLAARFLSTKASIVSTDAVGESDASSRFQIIADQLITGRPVVRALITAFEHEGRLFVVVCRAPLEGFDSEAREFFAITQSLAETLARSS